MKPRVFISHAWKDKGQSIFKEIQSDLRKDYEVWVDVGGINYGEPIREKLVQAIQDCEVVLVLWSHAAGQSADVRFEIQTALHLNKIVIPCLISDYSLENSPELQGRKFLDLMRDATGLQSGLIRIRQLLLKFEACDPAFHSLASSIESSDKLLQELEHAEYRMTESISGNEHADPYIQDQMSAGIEMMKVALQAGLGNPAEKASLMRFFGRVQQISSEYRQPHEDETKMRCTVKAIDEVDPDRQVALLQALKTAMLQRLKH